MVKVSTGSHGLGSNCRIDGLQDSINTYSVSEGTYTCSQDLIYYHMACFKPCDQTGSCLCARLLLPVPGRKLWWEMGGQGCRPAGWFWQVHAGVGRGKRCLRAKNSLVRVVGRVWGMGKKSAALGGRAN